jgi:hypothetical protein
LEGFSLGAAKLIAAYVKNGSAGERAEFRGRAIPLLVNVRVNPPQAISRYNPPAKKALNFSSLPIWDIPKDDPRRARRR